MSDVESLLEIDKRRSKRSTLVQVDEKVSNSIRQLVVQLRQIGRMIGQIVERFNIKQLLQETIAHRSANPHVDGLATVHHVDAVTIDVLGRELQFGRYAYFGFRVDGHFLVVQIVYGVEVWIDDEHEELQWHRFH